MSAYGEMRSRITSALDALDKGRPLEDVRGLLRQALDDGAHADAPVCAADLFPEETYQAEVVQSAFRGLQARRRVRALKAQRPAVEQEYWAHVRRTIASRPTYNTLAMPYAFYDEVEIYFETRIVWVDESAYDREENEWMHASLSNYGGYSHEVKREEVHLYMWTPSEGQTFGDVVASRVSEEVEKIQAGEYVSGVEGWFKPVYADEWRSTKGETMRASDFEETLEHRRLMRSFEICSDSSMISELYEAKALLIQTAFRRCVHARKVAMHTAAVIIQSIYRGRVARKYAQHEATNQAWEWMEEQIEHF